MLCTADLYASVTGHGNVLAVTSERSDIANYTMWYYDDADISIISGGSECVHSSSLPHIALRVAISRVRPMDDDMYSLRSVNPLKIAHLYCASADFRG